MRSLEIYLLLAAVLVLAGVVGRWRSGELRMEAEENVKDGKLSYQQARFRIVLVDRGSLVLTLAGIVFLLIAAAKLGLHH